MAGYGYNPYGYYPYGMVGQEAGPGQVVTENGQIIVNQAPMMPMPMRRPALVPFMPGYPVPALATDLPTNRVLGVVEAVRTPPTALAPVMGIVPSSQLLPGFKHAHKKVCKKSCEEIKICTDLPFRIEKLWVDGHDSCKFDIKAIIIGQRVLSTGSHFPAKYLKKGHGHRHGFHFPLVVDIDQQHPLRILVENKSHKSRRIRVAAWGVQLAE